MDDQKRGLLAVALIIGFFYVWVTFISPPPKPKAPNLESSEAESTSQAIPVDEVGPARAESSKVSENDTQKVDEKKLESTPVAISEKTLDRSSNVLDMTWTNRSGTLSNLGLKEFRESLKKEALEVQLVPFYGSPNNPLLWSVTLGEEVFSDRDATYEVARATENEIVFQRSLTPNLFVEKKMSWSADSYVLDYEFRIENRGAVTQRVALKTELSTGLKGAKQPSMFDPGIRLRFPRTLTRRLIDSLLKTCKMEMKFPLAPSSGPVLTPGISCLH